MNAQFDLTRERLAWPVDVDLGEVDCPRLLATTQPPVPACLREADGAHVLCEAASPPTCRTGLVLRRCRPGAEPTTVMRQATA